MDIIIRIGKRRLTAEASGKDFRVKVNLPVDNDGMANLVAWVREMGRRQMERDRKIEQR